MPRVGEEGRPRRDRGGRLGIVVGVDRRGADDRGPRRSGEAAASVGGGGGGWAATYSATDEGDDHRDSPGVPWASPPDHGLHGEHGPGFRKVSTKEAAGDGDDDLLRGPVV